VQVCICALLALPGNIRLRMQHNRHSRCMERRRSLSFSTLQVPVC
jgi:hypothetical protein